ncbi:hypothetical protein NLJ89_g11821 [Agrocybe chaxingu]|uniref:HMG box domain-containing protein n=1 Tax=Agrocybe chaxingu TaxID=84603 RepID=A0A9W8JNG8_9AGAR|nr:hypothetical protein NLJ89_g11821 [Agrocybe chaxingu]
MSVSNRTLHIGQVLLRAIQRERHVSWNECRQTKKLQLELYAPVCQNSPTRNLNTPNERHVGVVAGTGCRGGRRRWGRAWGCTSAGSCDDCCCCCCCVLPGPIPDTHAHAQDESEPPTRPGIPREQERGEQHDEHGTHPTHLHLLLRDDPARLCRPIVRIVLIAVDALPSPSSQPHVNANPNPSAVPSALLHVSVSSPPASDSPSTPLEDLVYPPYSHAEASTSQTHAEFPMPVAGPSTSAQTLPSTSTSIPRTFPSVPPPGASTSTGGRNHSKRRDPSYIPRPPNAFILFRSAFIREQNVPGKVEGNHSKLSKIIGLCWKQLPPEEREKWEARAVVAQAEHRAQYPDWRFRPGANALAKLNKSNNANTSSVDGASGSTQGGGSGSSRRRNSVRQTRTKEKGQGHAEGASGDGDEEVDADGEGEVDGDDYAPPSVKGKGKAKDKGKSKAKTKTSRLQSARSWRWPSNSGKGIERCL